LNNFRLSSSKKVEEETLSLISAIREKLSRAEYLEREVNSNLKELSMLDGGGEYHPGKVKKIKSELLQLSKTEYPNAQR
jgi:hypothetical protein